MTVLMGVIADDFTGCTDLAAELVRAGLSTELHFGLPDPQCPPPRTDAVIVALKSRTAPAAVAVADSSLALEQLRHWGAGHVYFKFCSTFDSTDQGNIGPVLDALTAALAEPTVLLTPAAPQHLRTQYEGYLFVDDELLSRSHMRHHPLTPMRESSLRQLLGEQTAKSVGVIRHHRVRGGTEDVMRAVRENEARGHSYLLADAITVDDLASIARAAAACGLSAGASGLGGAIAAELATHRVGQRADDQTPLPAGPAAVLSGSCSARTLEQIAQLTAAGHPSFQLSVAEGVDGDALAASALAWADLQKSPLAPVIYSSVLPAQLQASQAILGATRAAAAIEGAMAAVAVGLAARGVRRLVVAGGETAGAVVSALEIERGRVGREVDVGVPWIHTDTHGGMALLLKSGNFGDTDLLVRAASQTDEAARV
jgi:uncharacterized protein YgbK (DUF1537 family)